MQGTIVVDSKMPVFDATLVAIRARAAADRIAVLEPSAVVRVDVGTLVKVRWRVENGPVDPEGWEIRVSILGCGAGIGMWVVHAEAFVKAEGVFTWHATQEVVDWIRATVESAPTASLSAGNDGSDDEFQLPIMICLYDAAGRGQAPGQLRNVDDESLAHLEACQAFGDSSWIVCGASFDDGGKGGIEVIDTRGPRNKSDR
jgi:hypothetical protein